MKQLESALVIALRDTIRWEGSSDTASGSIAVLDPSAPFDPISYQMRDRQLAYRDLIVSAAVIEASVQVSDVYNVAAIRPQMEGPVDFHLPFAGTDSGLLTSQMRHVLNTSIPWDAARYADADLYGRDSLAYEVLARACEQAFTDSSVPRIDSHGTLISDTSVWSLAAGTASRADVNAALALDKSLFKTPDTNLADRDNQLAGYVATLVQVLKNPFEHALRIYVQVTASGSVAREADTYALISDDGTNRIFQSEPALTDANQIIYNVSHKTLQWIREDVDAVHVPQIYALTVPGIDKNEFLQTLAQPPDRKDAQYWRGKAGQFAPDGQLVKDVSSVNFTANSLVTGGYTQVNTASLTVPGELAIDVQEPPTGPVRFSLLVNPNPIVEIAGASNVSVTDGTLGGVDFEINVASGFIDTKTYIVQGGDGIVYNGHPYLDGMLFNGVAGVITYTQSGPLLSAVRQALVSWRVALPPGAWSLQIQYADLEGTSDGFGLHVDYIPSGAAPQEIAKDTVALPVGGTGNLYSSRLNLFDVDTPSEFTLNAYWTYGGGQLHIRKLIFRSNDNAIGQFSLSGTYSGPTATGTTTYANFTSQAYQAEVVRFDAVIVPASGAAMSQFKLRAYTYADLPLKVEQLSIQSIGTTSATPLSESFQAWREECLERAERVIQQGYNEAIFQFGTDVPTFRDSGSVWSPVATENWMSFIEVTNPRLRQMDHITEVVVGRQYEVVSGPVIYDGGTYTNGQKFYGADSVLSFSGTVRQVGAFVKAQPGHVNRPCLVPYGLYFDDNGTSSVNSYWDTPFSIPTIVTCQPWMIEQGLYVAQDDFWQPEYAPSTVNTV